LVKNQLIEN